jgi:hypothetical protein
MRYFPAYCLSVAAALLPLHMLAGTETTPVLLRYAFAPGQTNAYSVEIESQGEAGREAITGTFAVSSRAVGSNLISLTLRGQLRPSMRRSMSPMMGYRPGVPCHCPPTLWVFPPWSGSW